MELPGKRFCKNQNKEGQYHTARLRTQFLSLVLIGVTRFRIVTHTPANKQR